MRFQICSVAFIAVALSLGGAQVASHSPATATKPGAGAKASATSQSSHVTGRVVARVNGAELTDRDLLREMVSMFPYSQQHDGIPKDLEPEIRRGAMQMIIFEELLYQEAKRRNLTVAPARVSRAEAEFRKRFPTKAEYDLYFKMEGFQSKRELRDKIRRSLLIESMLKTEVAWKSKITPAQARAYYAKNPQKFYRGETIHLQSISILPPNSAPDVLKEAKTRAEEALKLAKAAKTYREFGLLAEKVSDDDFRVRLGDHKPRPRAEFPPELVKAAVTMKPGHVSDLIQLGNAFTIFRLVAYTPAGKVPFDEVKTKLRADLEKEKTETVRAALGQALRKSAKIEIL